MCAAFYDGGCGYECQLSFLLQFRNGDSAAVAHGSFDLSAGLFDVVFERTSVRNVGVNAFFELEFLFSAEVIACPVSGSVGTFAPVFFDDCAANGSGRGWGFVEACEVSAEHDEVSAHSECEGDVVVIYDAAVGAYRYIDAGFFVVFISCLAYFNESGSLAAANALCLTGDADGAAADADFDEVCASFSEEEEAVSVDNVACAYFYFFRRRCCGSIRG